MRGRSDPLRTEAPIWCPVAWRSSAMAGRNEILFRATGFPHDHHGNHRKHRSGAQLPGVVALWRAETKFFFGQQVFPMITKIFGRRRRRWGVHCQARQASLRALGRPHRKQRRLLRRRSSAVDVAGGVSIVRPGKRACGPWADHIVSSAATGTSSQGDLGAFADAGLGGDLITPPPLLTTTRRRSASLGLRRRVISAPSPTRG